MTSIILLSVFGIINLFLGFLKSNKIILPAVILFLAIVFGVNFLDWNNPQSYFNGMLTIELVREVPEALKPRKIAIADALGNTGNVQALEQRDAA